LSKGRSDLKLKKRMLAFALIFIMIISGCSEGGTVLIDIPRDIRPLDLQRTTLNSLPVFKPYSLAIRQVDLRGYGLTGLEIKDNYEELIHADFDTATKWPYWLPEGFNPKKILENGKDPGLGVRSLHEDGITGKGVSVAIISGVLLPGHKEYSHALKLYEEISVKEDEAATVEGCAQASLLVGKTTGVAPEADLYYFAISINPGSQGSGFSPSYDTMTGDPLIVAINRVVEVNEELEEDSKIRVLCIGLDVSQYEGYGRLEIAVQKAAASGIFVVSTELYHTYNYQMDFNGLGRNPMGAPDSLDSYKPGYIWEYKFYTFGRYVRAKEGLLLPMDARTAAAPTGAGQYAYYAQNDTTLCVPYIGGLYALACQVNPSITPTAFWEKALETGDTVDVKRNGISLSLKKIVNPVRLLASVSK